jgi:excisionase family DNA binding protein
MDFDKVKDGGMDRRKISDRRNSTDRRKNGWNTSFHKDEMFDTKAACPYLKVSRPTILKYIAKGRIKATKIGRGWRVFKSELDRFMRQG